MAFHIPKGNPTITVLLALSIVSIIVTIAYGCSTLELKDGGGKKGVYFDFKTITVELFRKYLSLYFDGLLMLSLPSKLRNNFMPFR